MEKLSDSRALHSRTVSYMMGVLAPTLGLDPHEAALCGWLHDFAYCFSDNSHHAHDGGEMLREQGYSHWKEIFDHGTVQGLSTPLGVLLNTADMAVDSHGNIVGFTKRLSDVAARYGVDSHQYRDCAQEIEAIKASEEWKLLAKPLEVLVSAPRGILISANIE